MSSSIADVKSKICKMAKIIGTDVLRWTAKFCCGLYPVVEVCGGKIKHALK
jgi:hypothetical protein